MIKVSVVVIIPKIATTQTPIFCRGSDIIVLHDHAYSGGG